MDKLNKYAIVKFIKFINDELNINDPFKVKLVMQRDDELRTYAYYNPSNGDVKVYCKNRGLADVLRSIAHELIHHHQNQMGKLEEPTQDIGGEIWLDPSISLNHYGSFNFQGNPSQIIQVG